MSEIMRLGRASAYAVFAVVYIAEKANGAPLQGRDIAEACGMPAGRLLKILQQLVRARVLSSERGPSGGFRLRRDPAEISLLEIVESLEGPIEGDLAILTHVQSMERAKAGVEAACNQVADFARRHLGETTISQLMSEKQAVAESSGDPLRSTG